MSVTCEERNGKRLQNDVPFESKCILDLLQRRDLWLFSTVQKNFAVGAQIIVEYRSLGEGIFDSSALRFECFETGFGSLNQPCCHLLRSKGGEANATLHQTSGSLQDLDEPRSKKVVFPILCKASGNVKRRPQ